MNDCSLKIYSQYDYDNDVSFSEARISIPHTDSTFLLEPLKYSTAQMSFSGYGKDDNAATDNLIKKLEANAKTLQAIADSLKK